MHGRLHADKCDSPDNLQTTQLFTKRQKLRVVTCCIENRMHKQCCWGNILPGCQQYGTILLSLN